MTFLLLSVLFSSLIFVLFRWIGLRNMNTFQVIVVNYLTAALFGYFVLTGGINLKDISRLNSLTACLLLGSSFIAVFYLMALTTQKNGTGTAVVANKMSLVIPVVYAFVVYGDDISFLKVTGVVTALAGVYLSVMKRSGFSHGISWLPVLLFFSSGFIDVAIKQLSHGLSGTKEQDYFVPTVFLSAFLTGAVWLFVKSRKTPVKWNVPVVLTGMVLGVVNFFSIYFLVMALNIKELQSSVLFPLNNISIVLLSTFLGALLFSEKLTPANKAGIFLAVIAILLISFSR